MRLLFCLLGFLPMASFGQAGLSASPIKFHYQLPPGGSETQTITIMNPTNAEVEVGVSFGDWNYGENGENKLYDAGTLETSCANWIKVLPTSYFVLQPHEQKKLDLVLSVPADANTEIPVHTGMVFFTQLNPGDSGREKDGAAIKVAVRMGVKIYHSFFPNTNADVEITDFNTFEVETNEKGVYLVLESQGKIWTNGNVNWELFNKNTGKKEKLEKTKFFTLPGNKRRLEPQLPEDLQKGNYTLTAIVKYEDSDAIKIADLDFSVE